MHFALSTEHILWIFDDWVVLNEEIWKGQEITRHYYIWKKDSPAHCIWKVVMQSPIGQNIFPHWNCVRKFLKSQVSKIAQKLEGMITGLEGSKEKISPWLQRQVNKKARQRLCTAQKHQKASNILPGMHEALKEYATWVELANVCLHFQLSFVSGTKTHVHTFTLHVKEILSSQSI